MAAGRHNPSRRALLGAALAVPLLESVTATSGLAPDCPTAPPRAGADWKLALARYRAAEAEVRTFERETSGAPWAEQHLIEEKHGALTDELYHTLRLLLRTPAPDMAALSVKLDLAVEHEVGTLAGGEACLAALQRDARNLAAREQGG